MTVKLTPVSRFAKSKILNKVRYISSIDVDSGIVDVQYVMPNGYTDIERVDISKYTMMVWSDER